MYKTYNYEFKKKKGSSQKLCLFFFCQADLYLGNHLFETLLLFKWLLVPPNRVSGNALCHSSCSVQ